MANKRVLLLGFLFLFSGSISYAAPLVPTLAALTLIALPQYQACALHSLQFDFTQCSTLETVPIAEYFLPNMGWEDMNYGLVYGYYGGPLTREYNKYLLSWALGLIPNGQDLFDQQPTEWVQHPGNLGLFRGLVKRHLKEYPTLVEGLNPENANAVKTMDLMYRGGFVTAYLDSSFEVEKYVTSEVPYKSKMISFYSSLLKVERRYFRACARGLTFHSVSKVIFFKGLVGNIGVARDWIHQLLQLKPGVYSRDELMEVFEAFIQARRADPEKRDDPEKHVDPDKLVDPEEENYLKEMMEKHYVTSLNP